MISRLHTSTKKAIENLNKRVTRRSPRTFRVSDEHFPSSVMSSRLLTSPPPPPFAPTHSPALCFNTVLLRGYPILIFISLKIVDFLRKSRQYSDDSIETHLNALLPPRRLFSAPTPTVLEPPHCADFIRNHLFPTWSARDDLLNYCSTLAEKPVEVPSAPVSPSPERSERLDPYARRGKEVWEKHDELKRVIRQESGVEAVIRMGTWDAVVRRCQLEGLVGSWNQEMAQWKKQKR